MLAWRAQLFFLNFEKMFLSALNRPLELQGAVAVNPHLIGNWVRGHCLPPSEHVLHVGPLPVAGTVTAIDTALAAWMLESAG